MKRQRSRITVAIFAACLQTACGGGGGGGGSAPPPSQPVNPLGSLTTANAVDLATLSLSGIDLAASISNALLGFATLFHQTGPSQQVVPCIGGGVQRLAATDTDGDGRLSNSDVIAFESNGCGAPSLSMRLEITALTGGPTAIQSLAGAVSIEINATASIDASYSLTFTEDAEQRRVLLSNIAVDISGTGIPAQSVDRGMADAVTKADGTYEIRISGDTEIRDLGGMYRFSTIDVLTGDSGGYPAEGALEFRGRDQRVVLAPSADPLRVVNGELDFSIGAVSASQLNRFTSRRWSDVAFITLFGGQLAPAELAVTGALTITSLQILPESPRTTDALEAVPSISNSSGRPIATTYEWWRNGRRIGPGNSRFLPASEHSKDQTIVVSLTVSNGMIADREVAATTILDSPAVLSIPQESYTANDGLPLNIPISAHDDDGDEFSATGDGELIVAHGPAGMTIDPVTRTVQWTPTGPRFGPSIDYHFQIATAGGLIAPITGTVTVAGAAPLFNNTRAHSYTVEPVIVDLSGDAKQEILAVSADTIYELAWNGSAYETRWTLPFSFDARDFIRGVATHDISGDGVPEIFISAGPHLVVLAGESRLPINATDLGDHYCFEIRIADFANDGEPELLCTAVSATEYPGFWALAPDTLDLIWRHDTVGHHDTIVANFDADDALEIATAFGEIIDGATGLQQSTIPDVRFRAVGAADLDGDGVTELIGLEDQALRAFSVAQNSLLWEFPGSVTGDAMTTFDYADDGDEDILIVDDGGADLYSYAAGLDQIVLTASYPELVTGTFQNQITTAVNIDDDSNREIIVAGISRSLTVAELEPVLNLEWTNADEVHVRGPFFGGRLATSPVQPPAIVFGASTGNSADGRLIALDPATKKYTVSKAIGEWFPDPHLSVADVDADGIDEVLLSVGFNHPNVLDQTSQFVAYHHFADVIDWSLSFDASGYIAADTIDINGDSRADLVGMTPDGRVGIYDLPTGSELWLSAPFTDPLPARAVDLDGNGVAEIVVADGAGVYRLNWNGNQSYAVSASHGFGATDGSASLAVGDSSGDGIPEVFVLGDSGTIYRFDAELGIEASFAAPPATHDIYFEALASNPRNLLAATADYSASGDGAFLVAIDARNGGEVWRSPRLIGQVTAGSLHFLDLAGAGRQIAAATDKGFYLTQ